LHGNQLGRAPAYFTTQEGINTGRKMRAVLLSRRNWQEYDSSLIGCSPQLSRCHAIPKHLTHDHLQRNSATYPIAS
jgi:hypothetical protein